MTNTGASVISKKYQKKNLHEHVLTRPGVYTGSVEPVEESLFVYSDNQIVKKNVVYTPGFIKIFDEILVNAIDHSVRDNTVDTIKVNIDDNSISVFNNGTGIPVIVHDEYKVYIPELIFGNLLTSTNYDDNEERLISGQFGLGSKVTNIFSMKFIVETSDGKHTYYQEFSDNMFSKKDPKITKKKQKEFTKITFFPDVARFGMTTIDDHAKSLMYKRVYDTVACTDKRISVYLNNVKLQGKQFKDYLKFYGIPFQCTEIKSWDIGVGVSDGTFQQMSFVNGNSTIHGGRHVDYVSGQIIKKLSALISTKKKIEGIKPQFIKDHLFLVVKATVVNPTFSSQNKETLTTPSKDFGVSFDIPDEFIAKIYKTSGIVDAVTQLTQTKNKKELDKGVSNSKKSSINVPKLEDARFAGTSKSSKCSLFLTEGDSAKTFAISGLSVIGREYYGVFPLRGVPLNVREATASQLIKNEELLNIKKIMGLQNSKTYETDAEFNTLRYGSIVLLMDADADGMHLSSLTVNIIHHLWPALLKKNGFIRRLKTPIVKATKSNVVHEFYSLKDYNTWNETKTGQWSIKYYKGLGTSTAKEAKDIFKNMVKNTITYEFDPNTDKSITLAFDKKKANDRKEWLQTYDVNLDTIDNSQQNITFTDSINKELIHFSAYDNIRSIPNIMDGLKPSQRKVLFTMFKRNQTKEIKVAQLGAAVAETTAYHHGEVSLYGTIVGMSQNFIGSNNINLLKPCGQFGTRLQGGKDAASPRYIFTCLEDITRKIYLKQDEPILEYLKDDGQDIEPRFYVTTVPMVLVNGVIGIGTGFSTNIPQYNIKDIIGNIKAFLTGKEMKDLVPFYKGFKGTIVKVSDHSFLSHGVVSLGKREIIISELPVYTWTNPYKEFLEEQFPECEIVNESSEEHVSFKVVFKTTNDFQSFIKDGDLLKKLKLTSKISTSNMFLFDENSKLKKFDGPNDIITHFVKVKAKYTNERKKHLIASNEKELLIMTNKRRFLDEIMNDKITVYKKSKSEIQDILHKNKYTLIDDSFNYLVNMNISSFNRESLDQMDKKITDLNKTIKEIKDMSVKDMLLNDLDNLL